MNHNVNFKEFKNRMYIDTFGIILLIFLGLLILSFIIKKLNRRELKKAGFDDLPNFFLGTYLWGSPRISRKTDDLHGVIKDNYLLIVKPEAFEGACECDKIDLKTIKEVKIEEVKKDLRLIIVFSDAGLDNSVVFEFSGFDKKKASIAQSNILYYRKNAL